MQGVNLTLPAGLQVREGDDRVREADLLAFFVLRAVVLFRNGRELLDLAAVTLSFLALVPVAAVVACGGEAGPFNDARPLAVARHLRCLPISSSPSSFSSSAVLDATSSASSSTVFTFLSPLWRNTLCSSTCPETNARSNDLLAARDHAITCEGHLKDESKPHDQVRRWQIVLLSWKMPDQTSSDSSFTESRTIRTHTHTPDHETSCGQVLSSGSRL